MPGACIRCGDCVPACPADLDPLALHAALLREDTDEAVALGLLACTGCGDCDAACPSRLPLSARFRAAAEALHAGRARTAAADAARERHRQRTERLAREAESAEGVQKRRIERLGGVASAALAKARARRDAGQA